ncbi:MAG: glycosyltransferase [Crocinitomicaceae bacterium]
MTDVALNIIIIGPAHPYRGGIALGNERLASELQELGHEVNITTFTVQYPSFLFPGKTQYSEAEPPHSLNIKRSINAMNPLNWYKVGKQIKKKKPDIVLFRFWLPLMGPCFGTIARIIKKNKHTKILTLLDNVIPHEGRMGDKLFTKYFAKPQDGYIAMSKQVKEDIAIFSPKTPCLYSPHPLFDNYGKKYKKTEAKKALSLNSECNYILFFGLVRDYKGLDLLIEGFSYFDFKKHNVKLLVAGEFYSNEDDYHQLIEKFSLSDHVKLVNEFIKDEEVGYYFSAADLLAQPYKSATQSGVAQIGYHFEIPMLVTNVGGLPEIVPNGVIGYVVERNPIEIGNALTDFYEEKKGDIFSGNFAQEKEKFTWDKMAATLLELYQSEQN